MASPTNALEFKALELMRADYPGAKINDNPQLFEDYKQQAEKLTKLNELAAKGRGRIIELDKLDAREKVAALKEALELAEFELANEAEVPATPAAPKVKGKAKPKKDAPILGGDDGVERKPAKVRDGKAAAREIISKPPSEADAKEA